MYSNDPQSSRQSESLAPGQQHDTGNFLTYMPGGIRRNSQFRFLPQTLLEELAEYAAEEGRKIDVEGYSEKRLGQTFQQFIDEINDAIRDSKIPWQDLENAQARYQSEYTDASLIALRKMIWPIYQLMIERGYSNVDLER